MFPVVLGNGRVSLFLEFKDCSLLSRCHFHGQEPLIVHKGLTSNHLACHEQSAYDLSSGISRVSHSVV